MASAEDAKVILELYRLRTEETMRVSREMFADFHFATFDELLTVSRGKGRENAAWRQVISYWEMAAAFVLSGALDAELFLDTNGENFFFYSKISPYFEEYSKATGQTFMPKLTKLIEMNPAYQNRYMMMLARQEAMKKVVAG